ncbi:DUF4129 domain-containing protein [Salipaludibacillus sp. HK11]|uniref:DUF4129 domain-containing protein n=1 Tax=Salipaludibacillus sp. HK11 TaxID=3394320 RepID=UPI0039FCD1A2
MADDAKKKLEEIISEQEYQVYQDDSEGFLQSIINDVLTWLADRLSFSFGGSEGFTGIVSVIVVLLIVILLGFILIKVGRVVTRKKMNRTTKPLDQMLEIDWSYHDHLKAADEQENAGEYTIATRHMFLALLLYFHDLRWLEAKVWKTNWEYYEELRGVNAKAADFFYHFVLFFDQITYGKRIVTKAEFTDYRSETMKWLASRDQDKDTSGKG